MRQLKGVVMRVSRMDSIVEDSDYYITRANLRREKTDNIRILSFTF